MRVEKTANRNLSFTLQWTNAVVRDLPARLPFTFRLRLWASGLVEFLYNKLGIDLQHLLVLDSDLKIGLGDSSHGALEIPRKSVKEKTLISISRLQRPSPVLSESNPYYDVSLVDYQEKAKKLWVNMMDTHTGSDNQVVKLPFSFPFFGIPSSEVRLTSDATIYLEPWPTNKPGRLISAWSTISRVPPRPLVLTYRLASDSFTVQWEEGSSRSDYKTLLQMTLRPSGDTDIVYQAVFSTQNPTNESKTL